MSIADTEQAEELRSVELARQGDHDAFVALYRQHAPMAWRLALALTADRDLAAHAVAEAFARTLAPERAGSFTPFRVRLLASTRHVVLDSRNVAAAPSTVSATPPIPRPQPAAPAALDDVELARRRAAEVLHAFHQLPERWRTALWMPVVEGLDPAEAGAIVGVDPADARELFVRAAAGLRSQWVRDRAAAGEPDPVAPDHLHLQLQSSQPLPIELFVAAEARWLAARRPVTGHLALTLPGGRPIPRWAERSLLASTAALIALGITAALAVDRDPDVRRARDGVVASPGPTTTLGTGMPPEPKAYLDEDDSVNDVHLAPSAGSASRRDARIVVVAAAASAGTTATTVGPADRFANDSDAGAPVPSTPSTTAPPVLQITAGLAPLLGVALGDGCTGLEVVGLVVGCAPATKDDGVTLDVGGTLLGGG